MPDRRQKIVVLIKFRSYAVVTCEMKIFQNYFTGLLHRMNIFQHIHCRRNNFEIILELL